MVATDAGGGVADAGEMDPFPVLLHGSIFVFVHARGAGGAGGRGTARKAIRGMDGHSGAGMAGAGGRNTVFAQRRDPAGAAIGLLCRCFRRAGVRCSIGTESDGLRDSRGTLQCYTASWDLPGDISARVDGESPGERLLLP